jgi:multidrug efflux pump subunit AcrB
MDSLRNTVIPQQVSVDMTRNYGETANEKAVKLIEKLIFATASVVVLVFFSLGRREAAIVGLAVVLTLCHLVCLLGLGLYAQPGITVCADLFDWHSGG